MLLQRTARPQNLDIHELDALTSRFGFALLNKLLLSDGPHPIDFNVFFDRLCQTPPLPFLRLRLWMYSLTTVAPAELRQEFFKTREWLTGLTTISTVIRRRIQRILAPPLREIARKQNDAELTQILHISDPNADIITPLLKWIKHIQLSVAQPSPEPISYQPTTTPHHVNVADSRTDSPPHNASPAAVPASSTDNWVLRLRGLNTEKLSHVLTQLKNKTADIPTACTDYDTTIRATRLARELRDIAQSWLDIWPGDKAIAEDRKEANRAYDSACLALGNAAAHELLTHESISPKELDIVVALTQRRNVLDKTPPWLWYLDPGSPASKALSPPKTLGAYARALKHPGIRRRIHKFIRCLDDLHHHSVVLQWLQEPAPGQPPDDYIDHWHRTALERLATTPRAFLSLSTEDQDIKTLTNLERSLTRPVFEELRNHIDRQDDPKDRSHEIELFRQAVSWFKANVDSDTTFLNFETLAAKVDRDRDAVDDDVDLLHDWVVDPRARAKLHLLHHEAGYCILDAPLTLHVTRPRHLRIRITWNYDSFRTHWPSDWPTPEPNLVDVPEVEWRYREEKSAFQYSFSARFFVKRRDRDFDFTATASVYNLDSNKKALRPQESFTWRVCVAFPYYGAVER